MNVGVVILAILAAALPVRGQLRSYDAKYWQIRTDLDESDAREAIIRMGHLAGAYQELFNRVLPAPRGKLPCFLYRTEADYLAAGGIKQTGGFFDGSKLIVFTGDHADLRTWQLIQHEAFHQFAHNSAKGMPIWLEEGLAEYFGEMLFTGDGYVTSLIPAWRRARIKQPRDLAALLKMTRAQWNQQLSQANYDQVFSLVQFLIDTNNPKFRDYLAAVVRGQSWQSAWQKSLGDPQA